MSIVKMKLIWNFRCDIPAVWSRITKYLDKVNSNNLFNFLITKMFLRNFSRYVRTS
jgi:hypothetical protein